MAGATLLIFRARNMVMKYAIIVVVFLLAMQRVIPTEGTQTPEQILNEKEGQVTSLQRKLQNSSEIQCDLLASCSLPGSCSRSSCWPLAGDVNRTTCQNVSSNAYCPGQTCHSKKFDYTRPYVRLAPTTDPKSAETAITVCTQRELSDVFKVICNSSSFSRAFFGAVDGTYTHFPGSDQNATDCVAYDPRIRPWYRASLSVAKAVMVLLDVGQPMGNKIFLPLDGTIFGTAKSILLELLNTFSEQDYVNIITFSSTTATSLAPIPGVRVNYTDIGNSSYHPEFDKLKQNLSTVALDISGSSNISLGIAEALRNYAAIKSSNFLQIMVVLTDGSAATLREGSLAALQGLNGTKIFIFKLPQNDELQENQFLLGSPFLTQLRNMGGSFHVIKLEAVNKLYSIRAYFSFLAKFRVQIKNSDGGDYSGIYEDFEHVVAQIFSITKPAFSKTGELLGVVGLNVFVSELPYDVIEALSLRNVTTSFDASQIAFTAKDADIQNAIILDNSCPAPIPSHTGLCYQTDTGSKFEELACCNACSIAPVPTPSEKATKVPLIAGISVGALIVIVAAIMLFFLRRKKKFPFGSISGARPPPRMGTYNPPTVRVPEEIQNLHSAPNTSPMSPAMPPRMGH